MRLLLVALLAGVTACSFGLPDAADPGPVASDAPAVVADAPAVTPPADAPPDAAVDAPPPNGQHCHVNFQLADVSVSVDCDTNAGSATCQCRREGTLVKTCTSFSISPCSLPTCCGDFGE